MERDEVFEFKYSDRVEIEAPLPSDRIRRGGADNNGIAQPLRDIDISDLTGGQIWLHFETEKTSAIRHLHRYIDRHDKWRKLKPASAPLNLTQRDWGSAPPEFWQFKVARDGLLQHLDLISRLLDLLYPNAAKGLPTLYCIVACLTLIVSATWDRSELVVRGLSCASLAVATSTAVAGSARSYVVHYCKAVIRSLLQRLKGDKLTEGDRYSLESQMV
ncbi:uncharacterized protein C8A04DRAFT_31115 [Dichotomopilus funicola]|uniref:Uncharacterized protein n=1 Tax=Dichotomopilus funicola TaxID=1934379 RepID=A0AAN6UY41_9PEZI|nr:hypothetical protein C8A04DRAFT_31115 [Dichotomopilus funicola]